MSTILFHDKRGSFYHRSLVPKRLKRLLNGREQIWRSLKTADKDEATARSAQWDSRIQRLFVTLRKHGDRMTNEDREALVAHWLERELDEADDAYVLGGPYSDEYRDDVSLILHDQLADNHAAIVSNDWHKVEKDADELLKAAGLPALDHNGADFGRLCRRLLQAKQDFLHGEASRWNGHHRPPVAHHVAPAAPVSATKASSSSSKPQATGPLFSVVADKYLKENPKGERTAKPFRAELTKFLESIGGDRPVSSITKEDGRAYKDHILNVRKLGLHTLMKHIGSLSALFKWAELNGYITSNPVQGLQPNKKVVKKAMLKRRPFTDQELLTVLGSKEFLAQRTANPSRWWIVLGCLFTAARREEIAQLALSDIQEEDGIPFMRINDDPKLGQHLKNEGSRRRCPIHSSLIRLGFMEYVERIRQAGHVRLFPDLEKGHNGYADPVGKWFGRLVTKCGLTDPALVLHVLRHGAITKLHAAGVADDVVKMLVGHTDQTVHGQTYVHRNLIPLSLLREGLDKLEYPDVMKALTVAAI